jgi:hypothetical protein
MRILFAAARGARIETQYQFPKKKWGAVAGIRTDHFYLYRIHRDDVHLQYGPISTTLRKEAVNPPGYPQNLGLVGLHYSIVYRAPNEVYMDGADLTRSLYLLIVAEALADEGL